MRLLFYAVNKVGLGHAVRLSILQRALQRDHEARCHFFTDSDHVSGLFSCPGSEAGIPPRASMAERARFIDRGFNRALDAFQPDTVVCDTYWPQYPMTMLRSSGVRTILLMRLMNAHIMPGRIRTALEAFDTVLIPHHPVEISWTFAESPRAIAALSSQPIGFVGPIARRAPPSSSSNTVVFTVGGGGEWPGAGPANRIPTYLETFYEAAGVLIRKGHPKPVLAIGPLFDVDHRYASRFELVRTKHLYRHFGEGSIVVSRGGYNVCWEAIAASSRLVLCGTHRSEEDVDARCRFLHHEGLGRRVTLSAQALADAIEQPWTERERRATRRWAPLVNAGTSVVLNEVLESRFLRAREP
jgi:predicted glycosyltransferase